MYSCSPLFNAALASALLKKASESFLFSKEKNISILNQINEAISLNEVHLEKLSIEEATKAQSGGIRHRHQGLKYRLAMIDEKGDWRPTKRVTADKNHLSKNQEKKYYTRYILSTESHKAYKKAKEVGKFKVFKNAMNPYIRKYDRFYLQKLRVLGISRLLKIYLKKITKNRH